MIKITKKPIVVICGLQRSGSTWAYNVARIALQKTYKEISAGFGIKNYKKDCASIIKLHNFVPDVLNYKPIIISTIRDPRDMLASAIRRQMIKYNKEFLNSQKINYFNWKNTLI